MDAIITWNKRMSFTATADSGFSLNLGADPAVGGDNDGFRPLELMAISLGGCTAMDVISILSKKRLEISGFEVRVHVERVNEHPKIFDRAVIEYLVRGKSIDEESVLRAMELSALKYCPAQAMLSKLFPIELRYTLFEDEDGKNIPFKKGILEI